MNILFVVEKISTYDFEYTLRININENFMKKMYTLLSPCYGAKLKRKQSF